MRTRVFRIGGMTCAACTGRVENAIGGLQGVTSVTANIGNNTATVTYDESLIDEGRIRTPSNVRDTRSSAMTGTRPPDRRKRP